MRVIALLLGAFALFAAVRDSAGASTSPLSMPLSLKEAVGFALENSPVFDTAKKTQAIREFQYKSAFAKLLPSLDFTTTDGLQNNIAIASTSGAVYTPNSTTPWSSSLSLGVTENLYDNGVSLTRLIRYIGAELLIVMGTSSGESVFPRLNAKLRALGCDESVVALVLPAGYAFNHDGTCLYFATVSVFLAQAVGIGLTLSQQLGLLAIMLFTSKGGAGVAGSAIVVLASTLSATGAIPVASIGLILGVHRLLSSAFVPVNVLGNALATIVMARWERALDMNVLRSELRE